MTLSLEQSEIANFQAQLSVQQGDEAVEQGKEAVRQGKILMVFTIVTITFVRFRFASKQLESILISLLQLPPSFLSALFALDVKSFLETPYWGFVIMGKY